MRVIILFSLMLYSEYYCSQVMESKVSFAKGTLYGYWGYNRSSYSKSNMHFIGSGYDFTLKGVVAHDNPEKFDPMVYFHPEKLTIPQFNVRLGYYFKDNWALSFGYDHMKYLIADRNHVFLNGFISPGIDSVWSGSYTGEEMITNRDEFHYENSDGLNYLRFELTYTNQIFKPRNKDWFALSTNTGFSIGALLSYNDFTFAGESHSRTISLSGYGLSSHLGLRFEFFKYFFIQPNFGFGFHHQLKVRNRPNDSSAYTRHAYGYYELDFLIGFLIYTRGKNKCDSCPSW